MVAAVGACLHDLIDATTFAARIEVAVVARSLAELADLDQDGEACLLQGCLQTGRILEIVLLGPGHRHRAVGLGIDGVRRSHDMDGLHSSCRRGWRGRARRSVVVADNSHRQTCHGRCGSGGHRATAATPTRARFSNERAKRCGHRDCLERVVYRSEH